MSDTRNCTCPLGPVVSRPWGHWHSCAAYKSRPNECDHKVDDDGCCECGFIYHYYAMPGYSNE